MTRVDFYILPEPASDDQNRMSFACRLAEKALHSNAKIVVQVNDENASKELDDLMWKFKPESFVAHEIASHDSTQLSSSPAPVVICQSTENAPHHDVLINLTSKRPNHFSHFERLIEIVNQSPEVLDNARQNFAFYKSRGYSINTHKL